MECLRGLALLPMKAVRSVELCAFNTGNTGCQGYSKAPEGMRLLYDREHKRQIEMAAKIKSMSALYRGN